MKTTKQIFSLLILLFLLSISLQGFFGYIPQWERLVRVWGEGGSGIYGAFVKGWVGATLFLNPGFHLVAFVAYLFIRTKEDPALGYIAVSPVVYFVYIAIANNLSSLFVPWLIFQVVVVYALLHLWRYTAGNGFNKARQ
ncbi:hypothetical protein [Microbulbifer taiwanensis]|uniref:Uncharacterized protein n=1 Tax=Microbulbifer taiwanensis TaxID=986746 RepID=A0ABW1YS89_9GAMM|nr:hypothetical protein [Microbulbifer taiwanensis]